MSKNIKANGLNHLAISTNNMKEQIAFYTDVLGFRLVALYWMHGVEGCWHGFLEMNDSSQIAFVFNPANKDAKVEYGVTNPGHTGGPSAPGTMQHLAFNVDTLDDLLNIRDRIRSRGYNVMGPMDHGMCHSIYFQGPEDTCLEVATFGNADYPIGPKDWIDPEVQELAGISDEELAKFTNPADFEGQGGKIPNPGYNPDSYNPDRPAQLLQGMFAMSDEQFAMMPMEKRPPSMMSEEDRKAKHAAE